MCISGLALYATNQTLDNLSLTEVLLTDHIYQYASRSYNLIIPDLSILKQTLVQANGQLYTNENMEQKYHILMVNIIDTLLCYSETSRSK